MDVVRQYADTFRNTLIALDMSGWRKVGRIEERRERQRTRSRGLLITLATTINGEPLDIAVDENEWSFGEEEGKVWYDPTDGDLFHASLRLVCVISDGKWNVIPSPLRRAITKAKQHGVRRARHEYQAVRNFSRAELSALEGHPGSGLWKKITGHGFERNPRTAYAPLVALQNAYFDEAFRLMVEAPDPDTL